MVEQHDLDQLQADLEGLRRLMSADRDRFEDELRGLLTRAGELKAEAEGGRFQPAVDSVHDLLVTVARGVQVQRELLERTARSAIDSARAAG